MNFSLINKGSWILDPYVGIGSTLIAAIKNNRNVVGIEKEEKYVQKAKDRIKRLLNGTLRIRPITKPIHKPSPKDKVARLQEESLFGKAQGKIQ